MKFIKEDGVWRIFSLNTERGGLNKQQANQLVSMPENSELVKLVNETMLAFAKSVNAANMQQFYDHTAVALQNQTSPDQLKTIFKAFIDQQINMLGLQQLSPEFVNGPVINDENVLQINGHYPSKPLRVTFEHKYVKEGTAWKLVAINVDAKPVEQAESKN